MRGGFNTRPAFVLLTVSGGKRVDDDRHPAFGPTANGTENSRQFPPVQVSISKSPTADWRRLFYDAQQDVQPEFPPRSVEISGTFLRFKSDPNTVEQKVGWIDRWLERANTKEAWIAGRSSEM